MLSYRDDEVGCVQGATLDAVVNTVVALRLAGGYARATYNEAFHDVSSYVAEQGGCISYPVSGSTSCAPAAPVACTPTKPVAWGITGLIAAGANITITGAGICGNPYVIASTSTSSGGGTWGSITGTLSDQEDLQAALDALQSDVDDEESARIAADLVLAGDIGDEEAARIAEDALKGNLAGGNTWTGNQQFETIDADYIDLSVGSAPAYQEGRVFYDSDTNTLAYYTDEPDVTLNVGEENWITARNASGVTIVDGAAVYVNGAVGQTPRIELAQADAAPTSRLIGFATHDIENNTVGRVTVFGVVRNLDTSSFLEGDELYLSAAAAGEYTTTPPAEPNLIVRVGTVTRSHPVFGTILVRPEVISVDLDHVLGAQDALDAKANLDGGNTFTGTQEMESLDVDGQGLLVDGDGNTYIDQTLLDITASTLNLNSTTVNMLVGTAAVFRTAGSMAKSGANTDITSLAATGNVGAAGNLIASSPTSQLRLYNVGAEGDANFERGLMRWNSNALEIGTQAGGTGVVRAVSLIGGNVGIGTAGPLFKVDIRSSDSTLGIYTNLTTGIGNGRAFQVSANGESFARATFYSDGKYGIGPGNATRDVFLARSGVNTFQISSDGSTGSANLTVNGNVEAATFTASGDLICSTAGKGLQLKAGTGVRAGNATLVGGTVTVSNTTVTANTLILLTRKTSGGTLGTAITYTVSGGTSFTINSDSASDTSTFSYLLIEVNP